MGIHTCLTQRLLQIILASLSLYASHSHGSPLSDSTQVCPRGWYQYGRFCVTRGQGSSDRAIALYCDGFGGIGIKGLCIIKVHTDDQASSIMKEDGAVNFSLGLPVSAPDIQQPISEVGQTYTPLSDDSAASMYRDSALKDISSSDFLHTDVLGSLVQVDDGLCPKGWTHYGSMCVYKPWSVAERCHLLNSVEFHGLCVKHADIQTADNRDVENVYSKEKRICCCASFKAKGNNYGC